MLDGGPEASLPPKGEPNRLSIFMFDVAVVGEAEGCGTDEDVDEPMISSSVGGSLSSKNTSVILLCETVKLFKMQVCEFQGFFKNWCVVRVRGRRRRLGRRRQDFFRCGGLASVIPVRQVVSFGHPCLCVRSLVWDNFVCLLGAWTIFGSGRVCGSIASTRNWMYEYQFTVASPGYEM